MFLFNDLGKTTPVEDFRNQIAAKLQINDASTLKLIAKGKILEDGQTLFHYRLDDNLLVHVQNKPAAENAASSDPPPSTKPKEMSSENFENLEPGESEYFDVGQPVDVQENGEKIDHPGYWLQGKIEKICKKPPGDEMSNESYLDGLIYFCSFDK